MSKCPVCGKDVKIPINTELNMDSYGNTCLTVTECCGQLVQTVPFSGYRVEKYTGFATEDDWGRKPRKEKQS